MKNGVYLFAAVAWTALTAPCTIAATIPDGMQWGVTFGFYATNGYFGSVEAKAEIDAIARAGATWVTVVPTVWQDSCSSPFQYKDFALTPNDRQLHARAVGAVGEVELTALNVRRAVRGGHAVPRLARKAHAPRAGEGRRRLAGRHAVQVDVDALERRRIGGFWVDPRVETGQVPVVACI